MKRYSCHIHGRREHDVLVQESRIAISLYWPNSKERGMKKSNGSYRGNGQDRTGAGWQAGLALLGMLACGVASGQQGVHPGLTDRFTIQIGAYAPQADTTAFLNSSTLARGTSISFEDDLNLTDRKTVPAILGSWRFGEKWRVEAEYFTLHRSGARALARTINWGDNTYTVGT